MFRPIMSRPVRKSIITANPGAYQSHIIVPKGGTMLRRDFLKAGMAGATTFAALQSRVFAEAGDKRLRVALIGCGWYGKTDLLHLMQVAPVEVVGLCDVDSTMLKNAAELVSQRQPSRT